jgi:hypothetical protein
MKRRLVICDVHKVLLVSSIEMGRSCCRKIAENIYDIVTMKTEGKIFLGEIGIDDITTSQEFLARTNRLLSFHYILSI